jgi:Family of unknown function (DUF6361)
LLRPRHHACRRKFRLYLSASAHCSARGDFNAPRIYCWPQRLELVGIDNQASSVNAGIDSAFVWETAFGAKLGPSLKSQIAHAQNFSELMHGAALLYNFMLACDANRKRLQDEYRDELRGWAELVEAARPRYASWDRKRFWTIVSESTHAVSSPARKFVDGWIDHTLRSAKLTGVADDAVAQSLVPAREAQVKRTGKRLGNARALERWNEASGAGQIDYRWFRVKTIATRSS